MNQNKTFEEEVGGGYMWSPQLKKNGMKNPFTVNSQKLVTSDHDPAFKQSG